MRDDEVKLWARQATSWKLNEECGPNPPSSIKDALLARSWEAWTRKGIKIGKSSTDYTGLIVMAYAL